MIESKACRKCGTVRPLVEFPVVEKCLGGHSHVCKPCISGRNKLRNKGLLPPKTIDPPGMRTCKKCGTVRTLGEFIAAKGNKGGKGWTCKVCGNAAIRARYAKNPENWRRRREKSREYAKLRARAWYAANTQRARAAMREYRIKNKDYLNSYWKEWKRKNPHVKDTYQRNRKARLLNAIGSHTKEDVFAILMVQKGRCACCKRALRGKYEVDHIIPLSCEGTNYRNNLQIMCVSCNRKKWAKHPVLFMRERGFLI